MGNRRVRGSSRFWSWGSQRTLQPAWQPQQSLPALLRTAQPCFLLPLRLLKGKIRFAFCSASLTESFAQRLGEKQNPLTVPALGYWLSRQGPQELSLLLSQLALRAHAGVEALCPCHRDISLPQQLCLLLCLWGRKP